MRALKVPSKSSRFFFNAAQPAQGAIIAEEILKVLTSPHSFDVGLVIAESRTEAELLFARIDAFLKISAADLRVRMLPDVKEGEGHDADRFDAFCERTGTLNAVSAGGGRTAVVATPEALFARVPKPGGAAFLKIKKGDKLAFEEIRNTLVSFGYYNEILCEAPGQFAVRGGIIDIYPIAAHSPYRIDLFGDEVEGIRTFDPNTQLSDGKVSEMRIDSSAVQVEGEAGAYAIEYFYGKKILFIMPEPAVLAQKFPELFYADEGGALKERSFMRAFESGAFAKGSEFRGVASIDAHGGLFEDALKIKFFTEDLSEYRPPSYMDAVGFEAYEAESSLREKFIKRLASWSKNGREVFIEAESDGEKKRIKEMFAEAGEPQFECRFIQPFFGEGFAMAFKVAVFEASQDEVQSAGVKKRYALSWGGLSSNADGAVVVSSYEFFGRRIKINLAPRRKMLSHRAQVDQLLDFSELGEGDYVVHLGQGICRYHGVCELDVDGARQEVIKLEFEDSAYLYLPLHKAHLISRYIGLDKSHPKLSKLDSKSWIKVRSAAEMAAFDYASELLDVQSKREVAEGHAFPEDERWQTSFEESFPFTETKDQLRAIAEVKTDMQTPRPMERLICADVGFGKTEVAMRAAFKCALAGKQAAVLCPTTILCQQHFKNFKERMAGYPIVVEMLSRFRTRAEADRIKTQLLQGKIDILIGTHAMLSNDVAFKDLGLLVIDEEHRFGVKHKERIKKIKESIDVLSMSATPIPRTLYFAMMGAKQISLIETPPKDRFPVETIVKEYADDTVVNAINAEIARGGQVFYLHNRVKTIEETAKKLRELFPKLRIGVGHGQMPEHKLEKLMSQFIDGKFDILVCTTIIESGLDIQNCNTIIIEGADKFGLAQLYQLRGRVGRFTRRAYAYLLLHRHAKLIDSARKRLGAIRQYNTVGAGFRIATRDLQLRGCGNLLGAKQSGHIAGVGFDIYCRLLKQSIAILKGDKTASRIRAVVRFDFARMGHGSFESDSALDKADTYYREMRIKEIVKQVKGGLCAYIPTDYITQAQLRIDLYRRAAMCVSLNELEEIKAAALDRFGPFPQELDTLFMLTEIRILAEINGFSAVETEGDRLKLRIAASKDPEFFKVLERFPRLTKTEPHAKLLEIKHFLANVVKSLRNSNKKDDKAL